MGRSAKVGIGACVAISIAALAGPAAGHAATVSVAGSTLSIVDPTGGTGEANRLAVTAAGAGLLISDAGPTPTVGSGCSATADAKTVRCPATGLTAIDARPGRGNDRVEIAAAVTLDMTIDGGVGEDVLIGGGGDDRFVPGLPANEGDLIVGGPGHDLVDYSGRGGKLYIGVDDNGTVGEAATTIDLIDGGNITVPRDDGSDCAPPLKVNDCEQDGIGSDVEDVTGGDGNDTLLGGDHDVTITGDGRLDTLVGGKGKDYLDGRRGPDRLIGGRHDDELQGGAGNDVLEGNEEDDLLVGGEGNDRLSGGAGSDRISGSGGTADLVDYSDRTAPVNVVNGCATAPAVCDPHFGASGEENEKDMLDVTIERVVTGSGDDTIELKNRAMGVADGGAGADRITGIYPNGTTCVSYELRSENVTVALGGASTTGNGGVSDGAGDTLGKINCVIGGAGDDSLTGADVDIFEGSPNHGDDQIYGGPGNDTLDGRTGADLLDGGAGSDTVDYSARSAPIDVSLDGEANDGEYLTPDPADQPREGDNVLPDVETVIGGAGDDTLTGSDNRGDELRGGPGADRLFGLGGYDLLFGEDGDDVDFDVGADGGTVDGGAGDDVIVSAHDVPDLIAGGTGDDTVDYSSRLLPIVVSQNGAADDGEAGEGDEIAGDVEQLVGGHSDDVIAAGDGNQIVRGGGGDDHLLGGSGDDDLQGDSGLDTVSYADHGAGVTAALGRPSGNGQAGESDSIGADIEAITGTQSGDTLIGTTGPDLLRGEAGDDTLRGLDGNDELFGGDGGDRLDGGEGSDTLRGDGGDDSLDGSGGPDVMIGGAGADTANYSSRVAGLSVSLDGQANDGEAGEGDNVRTDIENVAGGAGPDQISGSDAANRLFGNGGDDSIDSADTSADQVGCGAGKDFIRSDSLDAVASDCETVARSTVGRTSIVASKLKTTRKGRLKIAVRCQASVDCSGTLSVRSGSKTLKRKSFAAAAGKQATVVVKLPRSVARRACRRGAKPISLNVSIESQATPAVARKLKLGCVRR